MRNGFTFNGAHTSEFDGVTVRTSDRPVFPAVKEQTVSADEMDGEYDFTEASGHEYYNTRTFVIEFGVLAPNLSTLQKRLTALSRWFKGRGELIFDDIPNVKWDARVNDSVSYKPENGGRNAVLSVTYKAQPFSELVFDIPDGPRIGDAIELGSSIPLDMEEYFYLWGAGEYTVPNVGDAYIKPIIYMTSISGAITLECGGKSLSISLPSQEAVVAIDCEKEQISTDTGENLIMYADGEFSELAPGLNTLTLTGDFYLAQVIYTPKFFYDADFSDTEWGDE